ncbi:MAG: hypothetical protein AAF412_06305 [Pseudomonadota bacterium]
MRLAVYDFARGLDWSSREWLSRLLSALESANVHFQDRRGRVFDLDLSCFEDEHVDGDDAEETRRREALRVWFREQFCRRERFGLNSMPNLTAKGKIRFMVAASILVAAYSELEGELIRLANEYPS